MRAGSTYLSAAAVLVLAACISDEPAPRPASTALGSDLAVMTGTAGDLPANAPDRFGFGNEASEARIALWDIDVRPDGTGLPSMPVKDCRDPP